MSHTAGPSVWLVRLGPLRPKADNWPPPAEGGEREEEQSRERFAKAAQGLLVVIVLFICVEFEQLPVAGASLASDRSH